MSAFPLPGRMRHPESPDGPPVDTWPLLDAVLGSAREARIAVGADGLRVQIRTLCHEARGRGIPIERLIVHIKTAWWHRSDVRGMSRIDANESLSRLLTLCIREFYVDGGARSTFGSSN